VISKDIAPQTRIDYEERHGKKVAEGSNTMVEELQLVLPPPVEANQLMRFAGRTEETFQSRVLQMVGSWQEGTVMTIILPKAISLTDILHKFEEMSEIEAVSEKPLTGKINPKLLKKATAIPRLKNRARKTIFVTFEKDGAGMAS